MSIKLKRSILVVFFLFLSSCNIAVQTENTPTVEPLITTSTLPVTVTLHPSKTPLPSTPEPTITPVAGITSTQLNVRAGPSTASDVIGIIAADSQVQITGKDIGENWWQIIFEAGVDGKGWVTAEYVETGDSTQVPVIGGEASNPQSGSAGIIVQQLNIRSGPGTNFDSVGILNANDVVNLTGKNSLGTWLQIDYAAGPEGRGWVNAGFVKSDDTASLPILSDTGDIIGTGTPANTPPPVTPTPAQAPMDFDNPENPIKTVILGGVGTHTVLYNDDVSAPIGDREDWVNIIPLSKYILLEITCVGSDPNISVIQNEKILNQITGPHCNDFQEIIPIIPEVPVQIHVSALTEGSQRYTSYTIKVTTIQ